MKCPKCKSTFPNPEKVKGGLKSRRKLTTEEARRIAKIRHQKKNQ